MSLESQPIEILTLIFNLIPINDLLNIQQINKYYYHLIKKVRLGNHIIKLQQIPNIIYVVNNYQFMKYDFSCTQITDESVKFLGNCHTLNLCSCKNITDESVKLLGNCHTLDLTYCNQITDESVKLLGNCHSLYLFFCDKLTDDSAKLLGNCYILDLYGCSQITKKLTLELKKTVKIFY